MQTGPTEGSPKKEQFLLMWLPPCQGLRIRAYPARKPDSILPSLERLFFTTFYLETYKAAWI